MDWQLVIQGIGGISALLGLNWWWDKGTQALEFKSLRDELRVMAAGDDAGPETVGLAELILARIWPFGAVTQCATQIRNEIRRINQDRSALPNHGLGFDNCLNKIRDKFWKQVPGRQFGLLGTAICPECQQQLETVCGSRVKGGKAVMSCYCRDCVRSFSVWHTHATVP